MLQMSNTTDSKYRVGLRRRKTPPPLRSLYSRCRGYTWMIKQQVFGKHFDQNMPCIKSVSVPGSGSISHIIPINPSTHTQVVVRFPEEKQRPPF